MKKIKLNEFDPLSFAQGQMLQRALQNANDAGPLVMSATEQLIAVGALVASLGVTGWLALAKELNPITAIKKWFGAYKQNKKLEPIIARLKQDPEVMKYVKNKNLAGIQKVIASKLSDDEKQYIKILTRDKLTEHRKTVKLRSMIREEVKKALKEHNS